jgi:hypothetical protein
MSTESPPSKRDLTLAEAARRLEWKGLGTLGTGFMTALGLVLGVTVWMLQNTHQAQLERKQAEIDDLRRKLDAVEAARVTAVAEKDKLKEKQRLDDRKNEFLRLCMTYYSAVERHKEDVKKQTEKFLGTMYAQMYNKGNHSMDRDGYLIRKNTAVVPAEGFIKFSNDDNEYPIPLGVKEALIRVLQ